MNETTERNEVFYDATCSFCIGAIERLRGLLEHYGFAIRPLVDGANATEMKATATTGETYGGVDAILFVAAQIWWARPFTWLAKLPGATPLLNIAYQAFAARRHCINGACEIPQRRTSPWRTLAFAFLLLGTGTAWALTDPGYVRMWAIATALWIAFKCFAMQHATPTTLAWWIWPGMDASAFVTKREQPKSPIVFPLIRITAGLAILVTAHQLNPIAAGWCGMVALLLILHFGTFDLLAAFWQRRGYPVRPIMDAPWRATTLAAFWGNRWNRAFSDVTRTLLFRPLVRKYGVAVGTLTGFAFSGLLHELVITVPAGTGYGLATGYFMIQGLAVLVERRLPFTPHRAYVWLFVLAPAFWLFHPAFMTRVITPMLTTLHLY